MNTPASPVEWLGMVRSSPSGHDQGAYKATPKWQPTRVEKSEEGKVPTVQPSSVMVTQLSGFCGIVALTLRLRIPHRVGRFELGYPGRSLRVPTDEWLLIDRSEDVSPAECWPQYVQT